MATEDPDFVIVKRDFVYSRIPQLLESLIGFRDSAEWRELKQNDLDELPGVVLGALRRFLVRLGAEDRHSQSLPLGFDFIEKLAASDDSELQNAVVTEVFEVLEPGTKATREFYEQLGPRSTALYLQHCKAPWASLAKYAPR